MADRPPPRPKLADPASKPRHAKTGRQERDKPVFAEKAEAPTSSMKYWEVEVTPLVDTTATGRGLDSGLQRPRATFEVRALYYGTGLPAFGSQPNTRMVPQSWEEDEELALAIARRWAELLRGGARDLDLLEVAKDVKERRA